ncbi:MAG: OmpA family protein [Bacteroidota bacterium]
MLKAAFIVSQMLFFYGVLAQQEQNKVVMVSGKLLNAKDSSVIVASILFEKLPYYDDMGMITSKADGTFSLPLLKGSAYIFTISKDGFKDFSKEVRILGNGVALSQDETFYIESNEIELIKLENLIFARSSPEIDKSSYEELNELADWMNKNPSVILQLEGHTDFRGNAIANMQLSQARVNAVKKYLVSKKVKKNRILTKAFGGSQPVSKDNTEEAKARNRRVEVRVIRR